MAPQNLDHDLCLLERVEEFAIEQFVTEFAVEGFAVSVFPRTTRLDVSRLGADGADPISQRCRHKLRAVECYAVNLTIPSWFALVTCQQRDNTMFRVIDPHIGVVPTG